jgi:hypothetical protein
MELARLADDGGAPGRHKSGMFVKLTQSGADQFA